MSAVVDSPVIVLFEDRPKQAMVFQLNLSIYLDARVTKATNLKELKKALSGPDGIHLVITRSAIKGAPMASKILDLLASCNAPVPVICLGDEKELPGLTVVSSDTEVRPMLQAAAKILGITAKQMVSKQRAETFEIAPEFLNMLFTFPCDVFDTGPNGLEKVFAKGDVVQREKISRLVKDARPLVIDSFQRLKLVNAVTEQALKATEELLAEPGPEAGQKMSILSASLDMVAAQFQNAGMDEETVKLANASIKAVEKIAQSATSVGGLVKQLLDTQGGYRYAHCQLITFLGFHVIKMMGWWGDDQRTTISQAAFYHDICLSDDEQAMVRTAKAAAEIGSRDPQVSELLQTHPQLAARELQTAPEITPEIVQVVIQHHGSPTGRGFSTDIAKLDVLAKTFILSEEWCDYLMELARADKPSDNDAKIRDLKAVYKDEQSQQIIETFRYLDPEAFRSDFLSTDEVRIASMDEAELAREIAASRSGAATGETETVVSGGDGAGEAAKTVVKGVTEVREDEETVVKGGEADQKEPKLADVAKVPGPAGEKARTLLAKIHEKKPNATPEEVEKLLKAGGVVMTEETKRVIAETEEATGVQKFESVTEHIEQEKIHLKGNEAGAAGKKKIEGVTDVRNDEKIVVKGEQPQDIVDRSIRVIKAEPQEKARELKMKALAGATDLMKASFTGDIAKATELLATETGVQIRKTDAEGRSAIHYAAMGGHVDAIKFLLEKGASLNAVDSKRRSPLFFSALYRRNEAFDFLLAQGSKISQQAMGGMTIAMIAASSGNLHVLRTALQKGVRAEVKDHNGKTALDYAKQGNHAELVAYLESQSKTSEVKEKAAAGA